MKRILLLLLIFFVNGVFNDEVVLYDAKESKFVNWTTSFWNDSPIKLKETQTDTFSYDLNEQVTHIRLESPLITVEPAWKLIFKFVAELDGKSILEPNLANNVLSQIQTGYINYGSAMKNEKYPGLFILPLSNEVEIQVEEVNTYRPYWYFGFYIKQGENLRRTVPFKKFEIKEFKVSYMSCPEITRGLAKYSSSPGSLDDSDPFVIEGECVQDAELVKNVKALSKICLEDGTAQFDGSCTCKEGFEAADSDTKCQGCRNNFFRSTKLKEDGISKCLKCGDNSKDSNGNTNCACDPNYYRFKADFSDGTKPCYQIPTLGQLPVPLGIDSTSITVQWNPPIYSGKLTLSYVMRCLSAEQESFSSTCFNDYTVQGTSPTQTAIENLQPYTAYEYQICVHNDLSLDRKDLQGNCQVKTKTTKQGAPTGVRNIRVKHVDCTGIYEFKWDRPLSIGGPNMKYIIRCAGMGDQEFSKDVTSASIKIDSSQETLTCQMVTENGEFSTSVNTPEFEICASTSDSSSTTAIVAGVVVAIIVIIVLLMVLFYRRHLKQKAQTEALDREEYIMEAVRELMSNRTRNLYVRATLDQDIVDLNGEEPLYEDVPTSGYLFPYNKLHIIEMLGEGNFAKVFRAEVWDICGSNGKSIVAVKELKLNECDKTDREDFESELELMQDLKHHPNVVRLLGMCSEPNRCMIVEYLPGGDLLTYLLKSREYRSVENDKTTAAGSHLTADNLLDFSYQISLGMNHIAQHGIVHRDLACRNILVGFNRVCKVADLGLARKLDDQGIYRREKQAKLPVKWLPPESIRYGRSSVKSDVWSFGILLWEIVTIGGVPYPDRKSKEVPQLLRDGYRMPKPEHCDDEIYDLMTECWNESEDLRPSFLQLSSTIDKMRNGLKTYINLGEYNDDAYLPLDDADLEFQDIEIKPSDENGFLVQHNV